MTLPKARRLRGARHTGKQCECLCQEDLKNRHDKEINTDPEGP